MNGRRWSVVAGAGALVLLGLLWWRSTGGDEGQSSQKEPTEVGVKDRALPAPAAVASPAIAAPPPTEVTLPPPIVRSEKPNAQAIAHDPTIPLRRVRGDYVAMVPTKTLREVGNFTLADAIQTQFWAIAGGNVERVEQSIVMEPAVRDAMMSLMENAPNSVRAQYATPEKFAAFLLTSGVPELKGFALHSQRPISETETIVIVDTIAVDQGKFIPHMEQFRRGVDGAWRRVITPKMVATWSSLYKAKR